MAYIRVEDESALDGYYVVAVPEAGEAERGVQHGADVAEALKREEAKAEEAAEAERKEAEKEAKAEAKAAEKSK
jgi:predicted RNase H-like HicB family nuclease